MQGPCAEPAACGNALLAFLHSLDAEALARISAPGSDATTDIFRVLAERLLCDLVSDPFKRAINIGIC